MLAWRDESKTSASYLILLPALVHKEYERAGVVYTFAFLGERRNSEFSTRILRAAVVRSDAGGWEVGYPDDHVSGSSHIQII